MEKDRGGGGEEWKKNREEDIGCGRVRDLMTLFVFLDPSPFKASPALDFANMGINTSPNLLPLV